MKRAFVLWTLCVVAMSGLRPVAAAADPPDSFCRIEEQAESIRCLADELATEFRGTFRGSSLYRELAAGQRELESAARQIRNAARSRARMCELRSALTCLDDQANALQAMVREARFRADRGWDPPLAGCSSNADRILSQIEIQTRLLARRLDSLDRTIVPGEAYRFDPRMRDYGTYGPGYGNGYGYGNGSGPMDYDGTYTRYREELRQGYSSFDSGRGIPDQGWGTNRWTGPRGNGLDWSGEELVLKLGGVPIRIR